MRIGAHRGIGYIAAGFLASSALAAPQLDAQGAQNLNPTRASERSRLGPARNILHHLVGTWRFEIWFAGNLDGAPDASGTRVVKALFDELRLEWTEDLDHSRIRTQGIIGFDPRSDRFFSASVSTAAAAPEFMTGVLDDAQPIITFTPLSISPGTSPSQTLMHSSALSVLDQDHFTLAALDRGWRAVFTRQP